MVKKSKNQTPPRSNTRRLLILAGLVLLVIAAYSGFWFYSSWKIEARAAHMITEQENKGRLLECKRREVWGYPSRIGLSCESVRYESAAQGVSIRAGALRTAAQIHRPDLMIGELSGPGRVALPGVPQVEFDWQNLRASIRQTEPLPERASLEILDLSGKIGRQPLLDMASVQAHFRPSGNHVDLAATVKSLALHMLSDEGLPPFDAFFDMMITDGAGWLRAPEASMRGHEFVFRHVHLDLGEKGKASASGNIAVRDDGHADGELLLRFEHAASLGEILANIFPESEDLIEAAAQNLAFFGDNADVPLKLDSSRVFIGPFEIGWLGQLP